MYFALSIAILLESGFRRISGTKLLLLLLIPVFYGGLIEILQGTCTTTRDADWFDFLSNITGVAFSFFILKIYYHRKAVFPK
jgi:VanZ family protein